MRHTPFDGSSTPFTIGLKPLARHEWLTGQTPLARVLAEKTRLFDQAWADVFLAYPDTLAAQGEVLDLVLDHLSADHPDGHHVEGPLGDRRVTLAATGQTYQERDWTAAPLALAAALIADDLVLMRRSDEAWKGAWILAAGCVCFPSSWTLREKFGRPLEVIHAPVPGVNEQLSPRINRIFDNLRADQPVMRQNWSIVGEGALRQERSLTHLDGIPDLPSDEISTGLFVRVEHQTLRKLAQSGDILFTIRIQMDPIRVLESREDGALLAAGLASQLRQLTAKQMDYKALAAIKEALLRYLDGIAGSTAPSTPETD